MDLSYGKQYEDFRREVQEFLGRSWPPKGADAELPKEEARHRFRLKAPNRRPTRSGPTSSARNSARCTPPATWPESAP